MLVELVCGGCGLPMTINVHGPEALEFVKKYDEKINGKLFCLRCPCGHDLHLKYNYHEMKPSQILSDSHKFEDYDSTKVLNLIKE